MGELTVNKFLGSFLAAALVLFGLRELAHVTFAPPHAGHHDDHGEEKSLNEQFAEKYAYYVEVAEQREDGEPEPVFDLGMTMASAEVSAGERSFNAKCATCHTINEGGSNGTGPNLYGIIGASKNNSAGFNYSGALSSDEQWTYQAMNDWLYNPSAYAAGTSMAFAGLRRDDERAAVLVYLAENTPNAPDFPAPLPAPDFEEAAVEEAAVEGLEEVVETATETAAAQGETVTEALDALGPDAVQEAVEEAVEGAEATEE